jgi:hypothetical protein
MKSILELKEMVNFAPPLPSVGEGRGEGDYGNTIFFTFPIWKSLPIFRCPRQ